VALWRTRCVVSGAEGRGATTDRHCVRALAISVGNQSLVLNCDNPLTNDDTRPRRPGQYENSAVEEPAWEGSKGVYEQTVAYFEADSHTCIYKYKPVGPARLRCHEGFADAKLKAKKLLDPPNRCTRAACHVATKSGSRAGCMVSTVRDLEHLRSRARLLRCRTPPSRIVLYHGIFHFPHKRRTCRIHARPAQINRQANRLDR
jgi:hypothetical protein